ncbi:tetratricopeptide repeat protein [Aquabacterium sp.]|uniref:tetratricopeptide repeat protein n=1 Tax=Aquabacterium sp. TaxID=1872578 RepID=UPI003784D6C5
MSSEAVALPTPALTLAQCRQQILQLDALRDGGAISASDHASGRARLERLLLAQVLQAPAPASAPAVASPSPTPARPARWRWPLAGALLLLAGLAAGYAAWRVRAGPAAPTGAAPMAAAPMAMPRLPGLSPAMGQAQPMGQAPAAPAPVAPHAMAPDQMAGVAKSLSERLAREPKDGAGWAMLARTYAVMGRHADAVPAFRQAVALQKPDAVLLADFADALAMTQQRRLDGEPIALVKQALALAPDNQKALSLAGTEAFDRRDYAAALRHWEHLRQVAPPDSVFVKQIEGGIEEARALSSGK